MSQTYFYEVGRGRRATCGKDERDATIAIATDGTSVFKEYVAELETFENLGTDIANGDAYKLGYPIQNTKEQDWLRDGWMTVMRPPVSNCTFTEKAIAFKNRLQTFIEINNDFVFRMHNGTAGVGDIFVASVNDNIVLATLIDGVVCDVCNEPVRKELLNKHKALFSCPIKKGRNEWEAAGYVKVKTHPGAYAVREATNIPSIMVPEMFGVYVPEWVNDAITMYDTNSYADLTLGEFLEKMGSEKK